MTHIVVNARATFSCQASTIELSKVWCSGISTISPSIYTVSSTRFSFHVISTETELFVRQLVYEIVKIISNHGFFSEPDLLTDE